MSKSEFVMRPIFEIYPKLKESLPWVELGNFPTPVEKMENLGEKIGHPQLYVKRDDLSSDVYGGNKVRKLEFVLADALQKKKHKLITFGAVGSNHVLATVIHGKKLDLKTVAVLFPQPIASYARKNLLCDCSLEAELKHSSSKYLFPITAIIEFLRQRIKTKEFPYIIPAGGSSHLGIIGYVNAVMELKKQIEEGMLPEPDYIFVPLGTCGTAAGIILGVKICNFKTKIIAVRVVDRIVCNKSKLRSLINKTGKFINNLDSNFPLVKMKKEDLTVLDEYFGGEYARFTEKGIEAVKLIEETEGIKLEGTYTGKTLAALIDYVKKSDLKDKVFLFWDTYNSVDLSHLVKDVNFENLPKPFHQYFITPCQELDEEKHYK